jgi:tryptophan synthase alpha subunit
VVGTAIVAAIAAASDPVEAATALVSEIAAGVRNARLAQAAL